MRVFKYRGVSNLERDINTLAKNQIFSASIDSLNDPFEAKIKIHEKTFKIGEIFSLLPTFKYTDELREAEQRFLKSLNNFLDASKRWGIYSLSKSYNDELLWAYYADSHRGFCIEYDLDELMLYTMRQETTIDVKYSHEIPIITLNDILPLSDGTKILAQKTIDTKSTRWMHESEIRIITGRTGLYEFDYRAVKSIYFGYRSDDTLRQRVMRGLEGRNVRYYLVARTRSQGSNLYRGRLLPEASRGSSGVFGWTSAL